MNALKILKRFFAALCLCMPAVFFSGTVSAEQKTELPSAEERVSKCGTPVFIIKDEMPVFSMHLSAGWGSFYEDDKNAGIGNLLATYLSLSGSEKYPGEKLHEKMESMGGSLSVSCTSERISVSVSVLNRFRKEGMAVFADLIRHPCMDEKYLKTAAELCISSLKRSGDSPSSAAVRELRKAIFRGTAGGSYPTEKGIAGFTLSDLQQLMEKVFQGKNMTAGIVCFGNTDEAFSLADHALAFLPEGTALEYSADPEIIRRNVRQAEGKIYLYPKDLPQATVMTGCLAPCASAPDNYSMETMNFILGEGSFSSRLMTEIRVKRGMAYSAYSYIRYFMNTGLFYSFTQVDSSRAGEALDLTEQNIAGMVSAPVSDEELVRTKKAVINSFIFGFETPDAVLGKKITERLYRLPENYYSTYTDRIGSVTKEDVQKAASSLFQDGLVRVVVGPAWLEDTLKKYGKTEILAGEN